MKRKDEKHQMERWSVGALERESWWHLFGGLIKMCYLCRRKNQSMNTGQQFKHSVWIVNVLRKSSFNKYRDDILDMFGLVIECDKKYRYFISNPNEIEGDQTKQWQLSALTTGLTLRESSAIKESIILEEVPAGYEFLPVILQAIRQTRTITKLVDPYAVKLFRQRWYMLADNHERMSVYSLDRMFSAKITDTRFRRSASFSPAGYFAEYFGTMTDGTPMEHVVLKAYGKMANLIRTLPLHASQQEHESGDGFTIFSLDIRPTIDFVSELMSKADGLDVLAPATLKARIRQIMKSALERNPE